MYQEVEHYYDYTEDWVSHTIFYFYSFLKNAVCILDFIQLFLRKLGELKDEEYTSGACREAYDETLANHHPFLIRSGAKLAICTLPTRETLLKRVRHDISKSSSHFHKFQFVKH